MRNIIYSFFLLTIALASCGPSSTATPTAMTIIHPTVTPVLLKTATPNAPKPTPSPREQLEASLTVIGVTADNGILSYSGAEVPGATLDENGLHIAVGESSYDVPFGEVMQRFGVKEGGLVVYDKDKALYEDPDMSDWPKVDLAFEPSNTETKWAGWVTRERAISTDRNSATEVGNTYKEYDEFFDVALKFLQPYPKGTKRLKVKNPDYISNNNDNPDLPFEPIDDWNNANFINPFRGGVDYWILRENKGEGRTKDTVGVMQQVYDQIFAPDNAGFIAPIDQDIQAFQYASAVDSTMPPKKFYTYYGRTNEENNDIFQLPIYMAAGPWRASRQVNLIWYYKQYGYIGTDGKSSTGKMEAEIGTFMATGKIPPDLQKAWTDPYQGWYHSLGW